MPASTIHVYTAGSYRESKRRKSNLQEQTYFRLLLLSLLPRHSDNRKYVCSCRLAKEPSTGFPAIRLFSFQASDVQRRGLSFCLGYSSEKNTRTRAKVVCRVDSRCAGEETDPHVANPRESRLSCAFVCSFLSSIPELAKGEIVRSLSLPHPPPPPAPAPSSPKALSEYVSSYTNRRVKTKNSVHSQERMIILSCHSII